MSLLSPKGSNRPKVLKQTLITSIDPEIKHGDQPKTPMEKWAVGNAYAFVHTSANKNMSNAAAVEEHKRSHQSAKDLRVALMEQYNLKGIGHIPRFTLNEHNITKIQGEIMQTYRWDDKSIDNPYRKLENCSTYSIMHDGTTVWVLPVNTIFLRVIDPSNLDIYKVPYSMKKVPGSFTGEVLCDELISAISSVKKVKDNAFDTIESRLIEKRQKKEETKEQRYKSLNSKLIDLTKKRFWDKLEAVTSEIQDMEAEDPFLKDIDMRKNSATFLA